MSTTRLTATLLLVGLAACATEPDDGTSELPVVATTMTALQTWSLATDPDIGRDLIVDGNDVVVVGTHSVYAGHDDLMLDSATIARHDATTGAVLAGPVTFGPVGTESAGTRTWLLDVAKDGGFYYATGKSDANSTGPDLCTFDPYPLPGNSKLIAQVVKYDASLAIQDCTAIPLARNGQLQSNEISGVDTGDGMIWIGGAGSGTGFFGAQANKFFATIPPVASGDLPVVYNDAYVARLSPDLETVHLTTFGTDQWDEVLAIEYEPENDMLYVVGSTKGDLCQAYPSQAARNCQASPQNVAGGGSADNKFDSYLMAIKWDAATSSFVLKSVMQRGRDGEDTFNAIALFKNGGYPYLVPPIPGLDEGYYLYLGGKFDADPLDGSVILDKVVHRVRVIPPAPLAKDVIVSGTFMTYEDPAAEVAFSEHVQGLAVTDTHVYASGARHVTSTVSHSGPCGGGTASAGVATVDGFAHPLTGGSFTVASTFDAPPPDPADPPGHDATDGKSIAIGGTTLYFIGQTTLPAGAHCGGQIHKDHDDDLDMVLYTHPL